MTSMPSYLNKLSVVKQIPLFAQLNFFELNRIARRANLVEHKKGELICKQGAPADAFYCLVSGRVCSYTLNISGQKIGLEHIHRGKHFGILSALTGENHSHNFEVVNDSVVLRINREDFSDILKASPRLGIALSQSLSHHIRSQVVNDTSKVESTILSVYAPIKGSGSSTYAINLALSLQKETDKKVLFISLASSKEEPKIDVVNLYDWRVAHANLQSIADDPHKILKCISKGELKIDLLNAIFDPNDHTLVNKISRFVSAPVDDYNYIIVDLPNEMDDMVLKTLTQSDHIHLVVADRDKDLETARQVIDRLQETLAGNFKLERISVILSGVLKEELRSFEKIKELLNYDIYATLPHIESSHLNMTVVNKGFVVVTPNPSTLYAKTVVRIARKASGVLVGLVLGGGAALGVAHIGVIRILERENIPIDIVIGSSMGALIGSMWAMGKTADELEFIAREFKKLSGIFKLVDPPIMPMISILFVSFVLFLFVPGFVKGLIFLLTIILLAALSAALSGLIRGQKIKGWLKSKLGKSTFYDTKIPFKAVAYDLVARDEHVIDNGFLVDAVCKSIAIPGVIRPVMENGQIIIDGGVLNPLPTNVLAEMGIKKIIAVNVLQSPSHVAQGHQMEMKQLELAAKVKFFENPLGFIGFRLGRLLGSLFIPNISDIIVRTLQATEYVLAEQSCRQANVIIHPNLVGINWFELYKVDELIRLGEEATMQQLPAIKELIKE
jgi:predicted acylesterase/phospholipase RssA/CRP-like cAMP-binding protein